MWRAILQGMSGAIAVRLLEGTAGTDADLVERLTGLVNRVYASSERGLWHNGATRTNAAELAGLVEAEEIAVATVDGRLAGAVRVHDVSDVTAEFGMLAAAPEHRGIGVGRALVDFAERHSRARGRQTMRLELLVPRAWRHPSKVFLDAWYRRLGYRVTRTTSVESSEPELAPLLATPCEFLVYEKRLGDTPAAAAIR
jgi:GNAT superfamily N-acetyltransferase